MSLPSMRRALVRLTHPVLRSWYGWWNAREQRYRYRGLDLVVLPGVFHPGIFGSTTALAEWVSALPLKGRTLLELGAGTGTVALLAARGGARVTASDVNEQALRNVEQNARRNALEVRTVRSDLFDDLPEPFDLIVINPPYYPRDPRNDAERAFLAGRDHAYFTRLAPALAGRIRSGSEVYMVLSADLDRRPIEAILGESGLATGEVHRRKWLGETQIVFTLARR